MVLCCSAVLAGASPGHARAASSGEDEETDGRLEGYTTKDTYDRDVGIDVVLQKGGPNTTLTWVGFVVMSVIGCSVLFKSAKRTHLD